MEMADMGKEEMLDDRNDPRGDAIGNTMYSQCWVLKVMMKLVKLASNEEHFSAEFENDLCTLWDMCTEKDVLLFVHKHGILDLALNTVMQTDIPRVNEILIGIIGNMCSVKCIREECMERRDIFALIMNLLSCSDGLTLIQVLRVLQSFACHVSNSQLQCGDGDNPRSRMKKIYNIDSDVYNVEHLSTSKNVKGDLEKSLNYPQSSIERKSSFECLRGKEELLSEGQIHIPINNEITGVKKILEIESQSNDTMMKPLPLCSDRDISSSSVNISPKSPNIGHNSDIGNETLVAEVDCVEKKRVIGEARCGLWLQQFLHVNSWLPPIMFILKSSKNTELLEVTWSLLHTLCYISVKDSYLSCRFVKVDIIMGLFESFKEYYQQSRNIEDGDVKDISRFRKNVKIWTEIVYSFTLYEECIEVLCKVRKMFMTDLFLLVELFQLFLPLDQELVNFLQQLLSILQDILISEPLELDLLCDGVKKLVHLMDLLRESKNGKHHCDVSLEAEALAYIEKYLKSVNHWISSLECTSECDSINCMKAIISLKLSTN